MANIGVLCRTNYLTEKLSIVLALTSLCFIQPTFNSTICYGGGHSWDGETYRKNKSIQFQGALDQIRAYSFQGNENILDIGSGDGEITSILVSRTKGTVLGLDIDSSMVDHATSHYGNARLKFIKQNASQIDYKDRFHLITSFNAAQWIEDQSGFLHRLRLALKFNGKILIGMPTVIADERIGTSLMVSIFKQITTSEKWKKYFKDFRSPWRFFSKSEYEGLLIQAGLKPIQIEITKKPFKLPSQDAFIGWMRQISPHLRYLPDDLKNEFLREVAGEYLKQVPLSEQGEVFLSHAQLEVIAIKD